MPVFFIVGQGGTLLRSLVGCAAVVLFVMTGGLLQVVTYGSGAISIDNWLSKRRAQAA